MVPESRVCTICSTEKPLSEFNKAPRGKWGRESRCKACKSAQNKARYVPAVSDLAAREARYTRLHGDTKTCTQCGETKPISEFSKSKEGVYGPIYRSRCKRCNSERAMQWHVDNPGRTVSQKRKRNLAAYGLTPDGYNALFDAQGGVCAVCGIPARRAHARDMRLVVDHDHESGQVRGLLCNRCNRAIGLFADDPVLIRRAISYLLRNKKGADKQGGQ